MRRKMIMTDEESVITTELVPVKVEPESNAGLIPRFRTPEQHAREIANVQRYKERTESELADYRAEIDAEIFEAKAAKDAMFTADVESTFKLFVRVPRRKRNRGRRWYVTDKEGLQDKLADLVDEFEADLDEIDHDAASKLSRRAFQMGVAGL